MLGMRMSFKNVAGDFLSGVAMFVLGLALMFVGVYIIIRGAFELQGLYFQASSAVGVIMFLAGGVVALYPARAHTVSKIERKMDELGKEIKAIKRMLESLASTG
jgi:membrane protein implicated in regulation of membrane protease activity